MAAFEEMHAAATKDGINLKILSATRNFNAQKMIWENKWIGKTLVEDGQNLSKTMPDRVMRAKKILEYSSMPSTSRHHWGTDMDLNALTNAYFDTPKGKKIYDWLTKNAGRYGFCQPYTVGRPAGYHEERWHWSYMPISKPLMDYCARKMTNDQVKGFLGAETAARIDVVRNYMLGVSQDCWNH
jgi:LAS superfamily LD-carboxypeptidase LdcB